MKQVRTPLTDEIRIAYSSAAYDEELAGTEFDLWLVSERQRVADLAATKERERIIKLLDKNHTWAWQHDSISQDSCASCESIALIKGSQNVGAEIDNPSEGENK